jgi:hypothetical protein
VISGTASIGYAIGRCLELLWWLALSEAPSSSAASELRGIAAWSSTGTMGGVSLRMWHPACVSDAAEAGCRSECRGG